MKNHQLPAVIFNGQVMRHLVTGNLPEARVVQGEK
jgi:hypothetical protein